MDKIASYKEQIYKRAKMIKEAALGGLPSKPLASIVGKTISGATTGSTAGAMLGSKIPTTGTPLNAKLGLMKIPSVRSSPVGRVTQGMTKMNNPF
jgi:hypothetical protein